MRVTVNGSAHDVPDGLSISALLGHLKLPAERVAIERNLEICPRSSWDSTPVRPDDSFEIVHFVGGG